MTDKTFDKIPYPEYVMQPTPEALKAIAEFFKDGTWPKPGTVPVKASFR